MPRFISSVWQFEDRDTGLAGLFRWYGTVPLELAVRVLDVTGTRDGLVADLCAGTGTFGEAAIIRRRRAALFDINPIAALIARCRAAARLGKRPYWREILNLILENSVPVNVPIDSPYTAKWFEESNLKKLRTFLRGAAYFKDPVTRDIGLLLGLSIVRSVAEVNLACTHHLVRKTKGAVDVRKKLADRLGEIQRLFANVDVVSEAATVSVASRDGAMSGLADASADVVVVHPPYLGVVNYHNVHRLALDLYLDAINQTTTDAASYREKDLSGDHEGRYQKLSESLLMEAVRITQPNGTVVLIQGDHRYRGRLRHPLTEQTRYLESLGFLLHERFIWLLEHNAGMHVERKGHHIDHNYICLFRR